MRCAIISDIHGNLEAFRAVLNALASDRINYYIFIGDVVGYGANPKECLKLLKLLNPIVAIAGNHEYGVLGIADTVSFSDLARNAILWTRKILDDGEIGYIKSFPLTYEYENMTLVHGSIDSPEAFHYVLDNRDACVTMARMRTLLCFIGHTHVPGLFSYDDNKVSSIESGEIRVDGDMKYLINVGSVGQPRDGDPRASYAIYDDEKASIEIRRVEYDVKKAQKKILSSGLPPRLAYRLSEGR